MVTEQAAGSGLDELILQIFEEQEEQFYFPITTQNSARNFVKALHTAKGFTYDSMYKEIEEFEHNFSAWRKGLGRVGIGNRVMERINRPLEEVLLSEDEDDVNDIISRIRGNKEEAAARPENDRVPPITSVVHTEETRLVKLENAIRRSSSDASATKRPNKDTSPPNGATTEPARKDIGEPRKELTESLRNNIDNKIKKLEEDRSAPNSPKLNKVTKLPGAELEQKQPGLVDFRSVLKRRANPPGDKKAPGAGDRRSMPPLGGSLELSSSSGISSLGGSSDTLYRPDGAPPNGAVKAKLKDYTIRAKSEPRILPPAEEEPVQRPRELALEKSTADTLEKNDIEKEFVDEKEFDSFEEEHVAEIKVETRERKASAPLAAADDEDLTSSSSSASSVSVETESGHSSDSGVNESSSNEQEAKTVLDNGTSSEGNEEEEDEENDTVSQNYDSDLDETNDDLTREGRQLAEKVAQYKDKVQSRDGPGYIYAFKESTTGKVKIGESRVPKKRLEQALCFNLHLEMISAQPVSLRKLAAQRAQGRLKRYRIDGREDWFNGPMDEIIDTITTTAERYPNNSSEC